MARIKRAEWVTFPTAVLLVSGWSSPRYNDAHTIEPRINRPPPPPYVCASCQLVEQRLLLNGLVVLVYYLVSPVIGT